MIQEWYSKVLKGFLAHKAMGLSVIFCVFAASLILFGVIGKEFMPKIDEGQFMIKIDMPPGAKLEVANEMSKRIEKVVLGMEYVKDVSSTIGSNKDDEAGSASVEMLKDNQAQQDFSGQPHG